MNIDHIVLWVEDPRRSVDFYVTVLGMEPVRFQEFEKGLVSFPSIRLNDTTIIDLMNKDMLADVQEFTGGGDSGGSPVNHVCFAVDAVEFAAIRDRLLAQGTELTRGSERSFGAQGEAGSSGYFCDPDGNVIEIRYYG